MNADEHELARGGSHDGKRHPITASGVTEVSFNMIDDHTLDSTAYCSGEVVMTRAGWYQKTAICWLFRR